MHLSAMRTDWKRGNGMIAIAAMVLAAPMIALTAAAQNYVGQTQSHFLRGTVAEIDQQHIVVKQDSSSLTALPLQSGWSVALITPADDSILQVGNLVNIVEVDAPNGISEALFVDKLPLDLPAPRGRAVSQMPGSDAPGAWGSLGTIIALERAAEGTIIVTQLPQGQHRSLTKRSTVMVTNTASDQSIVKAGDHVCVIVHPGQHGEPVAFRVLVGANGSVPPM